jgi:hypothetical protein
MAPFKHDARDEDDFGLPEFVRAPLVRVPERTTRPEDKERGEYANPSKSLPEGFD